MIRITEGPGFVRIAIYIQPNAKKTEPVGEHGDALKLKVQAPPVDGAANEAICEYFSRTLQKPLRNLRLVQGELGRLKVLQIDGLSRSDLESWVTEVTK